MYLYFIWRERVDKEKEKRNQPATNPIQSKSDNGQQPVKIDHSCQSVSSKRKGEGPVENKTKAQNQFINSKAAPFQNKKIKTILF